MRVFAKQSAPYLVIWVFKFHRRCRAALRASENSALMVLDTALGFQLGGIAGWVIGWQAGYFYRYLYEPAAGTSFDEIRFWYGLPQTVARHGMLIGPLAGMIAFYICSRNNLRKRGEL